MTDVLGVSITGLRVSQNALRTVGHNIANAGTEGYSRQAIEINSTAGSPSGFGFLGNGAVTGGIDRVVNDFVISQIRQDTSLYNELNAYNEHVQQLNDILSNSATGLTQGLESFFAVLQNTTDDPTSTSARQLLISESENLSDRFNTVYARIDSLNDSVNQNLEVAVNQINALADSIAQLNRRIADSFSAVSTEPNDLLDQRDEAIRELSGLTSVQVIEQEGLVNVTIGTGIPLLVGVNTSELQLGSNEFDPLQPEVFLEGISIPLTNSLNGGQLAGLLDFQQTVIDPALNELGRIGIVMADTFNSLQQQGISQNNTFGNNLFFDINNSIVAANRVQISGNNASNDQVLGLTITDIDLLTISDYRVTLNGTPANYVVTRLSDNVDVASGLVPGVFPASITFDGLSLDIIAGTFTAADEFLVRPTHFGASDFSANTLQPADLALGSPVASDTSLNNLGSGQISPGEVLSVVDANGNPLPLFNTVGEMTPPFLIQFTTATSYDILDNSDPGNPTQLTPPIRNQIYIPGIQNNLFTSDTGQTTTASNGTELGIVGGTTATIQASLRPAGVGPQFSGVTNFSGTANQFAFDVVVANTNGGVNDGTFTVTIDGAALTDNDAVLADINDDLAATRVRAYITDGGTVGFRLLDPGDGDITVQNYDNDPDGGTDTAPAGQANFILGFNVEGATFTTVADADGTSGSGDATLGNGYSAETFTFTTTDPDTGATSNEIITTTANDSARAIASQLSGAIGVAARGFNYVELRDFSLTNSAPLQITVNGQDLVGYDSGVLSNLVPPPALNAGEDFNDYLVEQINANQQLAADGIYGVSAYDAVAGEFYIQLHSTLGDDFVVQLQAADGDTIDVNDGVSADVTLTADGNDVNSSLVVGGRLDIDMADNVTVLAAGTGLFNGAAVQTSYWGIQADITGTPVAGDQFTIDFNNDAALDNRNGLAMVDLQQTNTIQGNTETFQDSYSRLLEGVGINANVSASTTETAENVLNQSMSLRESISGVNLDEEAADLIRFEQLYSANAQVINVARELFDQLLNSF